jgi:ribonuclease R
LLEARLQGKSFSTQEQLELLCKHSSDMERMAAEAERASVKYKQVEFMSDKVGQSFDGVISGVTEWGIYVEIVENRCEGMIKNRDLQDDRYVFDEDNYRYVGRNTGKVYALGDKVKVIVKNADLTKKQLDYAFVEATPVDRDSRTHGNRNESRAHSGAGSSGKFSHKGSSPKNKDKRSSDASKGKKKRRR